MPRLTTTASWNNHLVITSGVSRRSEVHLDLHSPLGQQPFGNVDSVPITIAPELQLSRANVLRCLQSETCDLNIELSDQRRDAKGRLAPIRIATFVHTHRSYYLHQTASLPSGECRGRGASPSSAGKDSSSFSTQGREYGWSFCFSMRSISFRIFRSRVTFSVFGWDACAAVCYERNDVTSPRIVCAPREPRKNSLWFTQWDRSLHEVPQMAHPALATRCSSAERGVCRRLRTCGR